MPAASQMMSPMSKARAGRDGHVVRQGRALDGATIKVQIVAQTAFRQRPSPACSPAA